MTIIICQLFALLSSFTLLAENGAKTVEGVTFPKQILKEETPLVLNGIGVRRATIFNVRVYVAGLYLPEQAENFQKIEALSAPKFLRMEFLRNVKKKSLTDAWDEGIKAAHGEEKFNQLAGPRKQFNEFMRDVNTGDWFEITFKDSELEVKDNKERKLRITHPSFPKDLLAIWFMNPRDQGLADGLLGK